MFKQFKRLQQSKKEQYMYTVTHIFKRLITFYLYYLALLDNLWTIMHLSMTKNFLKVDYRLIYLGRLREHDFYYSIVFYSC